MARSGWSTSNYLSVAATPISGGTWTQAIWAKTASTADQLAVHTTAVGADFHNTQFGILAPGNPFIYARDGVGNSVIALGSSTVSTSNWFHLCGVSYSVTSHKIYLNGALDGTAPGTSVNPTNMNRVYFGLYNGATSSAAWQGSLAESALWNVALDDAEIAALAKGISPRLIRPASLQAYWPLIGRTSPEIELRQGFGLSITGSLSQADHPRVIYPRRRGVITPPAVVAGGFFGASARTQPIIGVGIY